MGFLSALFYPWGLLLQAAAIIHFIRRRPDTYWIFIIMFLGPIGALIYLFAEVLPDLGLLRHSFKGFPRRKRIARLQIEIRDNPSAANFEELGDLYMDEGNFQSARAAFDKAISARSNTLDTFYRRGVCALILGDATGALPDLEMAVQKDPGHDFHRAIGLLAQAYALTGQKEKAEASFRLAVERSTLSETYLNYADFLLRRAATQRLASGRKKCSARNPQCLAICAAANGRGFAAPPRC